MPLFLNQNQTTHDIKNSEDFSKILLRSVNKILCLHKEVITHLSSSTTFDTRLHEDKRIFVKNKIKQCLQEINALLALFKYNEDLLPEDITFDKWVEFLKNLEKQHSKLFNKMHYQNIVKEEELVHWIEQFKFITEHEDCLKDSLLQVRQWMNNKSHKPKTVFISYAWPLRRNSSSEEWVQAFLLHFVTHLREAGIMVFFDIQDSKYGHRIQHHINRLLISDCVILIGTPSLKVKYETKEYCIVQDEITEMLVSKIPVIPLLLLGDFKTSFPRPFLRNISIEDWRSKPYVNLLKDLVAKLYECSSPQYESFWKKILSFSPQNANPTVSSLNQTLESKKERDLRLGLFKSPPVRKEDWETPYITKKSIG